MDSLVLRTGSGTVVEAEAEVQAMVWEPALGSVAVPGPRLPATGMEPVKVIGVGKARAS